MKKLLVTSLAAFMIAAMTGCSKELSIKTPDDLVVEYGEDLDNEKLFDADKSGNDISVKEVQEFDNRKIGEQIIKVTFTDNNGKTKDVDITLKVEDTIAPVIELENDTIEINAGSELDLTKLIKSVKDPVDGDIPYSADPVEKNGYFIDKGSLDANTEGSYEIMIEAFDASGNRSGKKVTVKVNAKAADNQQIASSGKESSTQQTQIPPANNNTGSSGGNSNNNNSGNNSSNNNTQPQQPSTPTPQPDPKPDKPQTCTIHPNAYGNSGKKFASKEEAKVWAEQQRNEISSIYYENGYVMIEMADTCDNSVGWTVDFYSLEK